MLRLVLVAVSVMLSPLVPLDPPQPLAAPAQPAQPALHAPPARHAQHAPLVVPSRSVAGQSLCSSGEAAKVAVVAVKTMAAATLGKVSVGASPDVSAMLETLPMVSDHALRARAAPAP